MASEGEVRQDDVGGGPAGASLDFPEGVSESERAQAVADWLRVEGPIDLEESFTCIIGGPQPSNLTGPHKETVLEEGASALLQNEEALKAAAQGLFDAGHRQATIARLGGMGWTRQVHNVPWGLIEAPKDSLHFELLDAVVAATGSEGMHYVGTFAPFAAWALECRGEAGPECAHYLSDDLYYLSHENKMDLPCEPEQIPELLGLLAERYDGDGQDDMPGLVVPIKIWQMGNEVEAHAQCGSYLGALDDYLTWVNEGAAAIHASCPDCQIMLGGALAIHGNEIQEQGLKFWEDFVAKGGGDAIDIIAIHYNQGKSGGSTIEQFVGMIDTYREIFGDKPIWVTEFGVLVEVETEDGQTAENFSHLSEEDAAAWLLRFYTAGLNAGVAKFFSDYIGFVSRDEVQLTFYTNLLIQSKLLGFSHSERLAEGQYRFEVNGRSVYVLWGQAALDRSITGQLTLTDMYGVRTEKDASELVLSDVPLFAEPVIP